MTMSVLYIVLLGALCAKLSVPVWLVLALGIFLTAVSAEIGDPYRKLKNQKRAGTVPAQR
jgi:hypothetical protein